MPCPEAQFDGLKKRVKELRGDEMFNKGHLIGISWHPKNAGVIKLSYLCLGIKLDAEMLLVSLRGLHVNNSA